VNFEASIFSAAAHAGTGATMACGRNGSTWAATPLPADPMQRNGYFRRTDIVTNAGGLSMALSVIEPGMQPGAREFPVSSNPGQILTENLGGFLVGIAGHETTAIIMT
jgi:hypothetical protein